MMSPVSDALNFLSQTLSGELFISAGCRPKCRVATQTWRQKPLLLLLLLLLF